MVTPLTRLKAGVSVPDSPLITAVIEYAQKLSEPYLFNHAMRSWLFGGNRRMAIIPYGKFVMLRGRA